MFSVNSFNIVWIRKYENIVQYNESKLNMDINSRRFNIKICRKSNVYVMSALGDGVGAHHPTWF